MPATILLRESKQLRGHGGGVNTGWYLLPDVCDCSVSRVVTVDVPSVGDVCFSPTHAVITEHSFNQL